MSDAVTYESQDRIALITINRPDRLNAINEAVELGLAAAWRRLNESDDLVAVFTGAGNRAFSVGKDLNYDAAPDYRRFTPGFDIEVRKPIVAAVGGWCLGGGLTLLQMCDLCVASENARFGYPEAKLGFAGGMIAPLAARIPHKVAMELMLLGEDIDVQRAYQVGLVNKVVPQGEHVEAAMVYARRLAQNAPLVLDMLKQFAGEVLPKGPMGHASHALRVVEAIMASEDRQEGMRSAREKTPPQYRGR
ncbi:enoyl-CoA hydratase [Imbroritus primus]|uniref:Enoyl-CoA hydratase n=1 Tax=Imbroritus primus TaxID=3058603 RepID=A0ACD3SL66_9BURK|nr:enoyl-CoA hydratase [Burkholderiaceae bacterium PBA]